MIDFFLNDDFDGMFDVTPTSIVESLRREHVIEIVQALGATNIIEKDNGLILPTICHNPRESEKSHKLYYYDDSKLFTCYTECGCSFNIYELVRKVYAINDREIGFYEAFDYVSSFINLRSIGRMQSAPEPIGNRYTRKLSVEPLPAYNTNVLSVFPKTAPVEWLNEGISKEAMDRYDVRFSNSKFKIIIPHYDLGNRLVGIRGRALDPYEIENYGKYMPVRVEGTFYTHHLSRNLYGANVVKKALARTKSAIVVEGEKSAMKLYDYYGENSVGVAVCGSNLHKIQLDILVKELGVSDITIAFDKEYLHLKSDEAETYKNKLIDLCKKYTNYANMSFIYDMEGLLQEKDAPVDRGKETFERLYEMRVKIR